MNFLKQPYPFPDADLSVYRLLLKSVLLGLFIFLFLAVFQPFNISQWRHPFKIGIIGCFGLMTTIAYLLFHFVIVKLFYNYFNEESWTVGREIVSNVIHLLMIAVLNMAYLAYLLEQPFTFTFFFFNILSVIAVGVFPISASVFLKYNKESKSHPDFDRTSAASGQKNTIKLTAENQKDSLEIPIKELYYISSADNYAEVHLLQNMEPKQELIRSSLARLEEQLNDTPLQRCHRSYIVNLDLVSHVTGNAQGYRLHFENYPTSVPVARGYAHLVQGLR